MSDLSRDSIYITLPWHHSHITIMSFSSPSQGIIMASFSSPCHGTILDENPHRKTRKIHYKDVGSLGKLTIDL